MKQDKVIIKNLLVRGIIGINDWERKKKQDILINVEMSFDTRKAAISDEIVDALNYRTVTKSIIDLVENSNFFLVEKLVDQIAKLCVTENQAISVKVRVEKPGALRFAESVGIEIERSKEDYQP